MNDDASIRNLIHFLSRGLLLSFCFAAAMAILAYLLSAMTAPSYEAQATLLTTLPEPGVRGLEISLVAPPRVDVTTYAEALLSDPIREAAGQLLADKSAIEAVTIQAHTNERSLSSLLFIVARGENPQQTADVANAYSEALLRWDEERAHRIIDRTILQLQSQIQELEHQINALATLEGGINATQRDRLTAIRSQRLVDLTLAETLRNSATGVLETLELASPAAEPVSPKPLRTALLSFALGLVIAYGLQSLREALDPRIKTTEALISILPFPVLAEIPKVAGKQTQGLQEAVGYLHTNLLFSLPKERPMVLLISSGSRVNHKAAIALQLAKSLALAERVLLIDADLNGAELSHHVQLKPQVPGLASYLRDPSQSLLAAQLEFDHHRLDMIPSFTTHQAHELLHRGLHACLERWKASYSMIIIDSPPLLEVVDALAIAPFADALLYLVDMQATERDELKRVAHLLKRSHSPTFVAITNSPYFAKGKSRRIRESQSVASKGVS